MKKIKSVVIDDEYLNRDLITKLINRLDPNFEIIGEADNIGSGFDLITECNPDLVFLDIKMPGGNGFELLKRFEKPNFEVVFITGFDEYALQAFEYNALDYILKPIDTDKLKNTLEKVYKRISSKLVIPNNLKEILDSYNNDYTSITKIPIHYKDKVVLVEVSDIISVQATDGYTVFKTKNQEEFMSSKQLSSFEFIINNYSNFCRLNKSAYINLNFIKSYTKGLICMVTLTNDVVFEVSRRKKTEILELLERN